MGAGWQRWWHNHDRLDEVCRAWRQSLFGIELPQAIVRSKPAELSRIRRLIETWSRVFK